MVAYQEIILVEEDAVCFTQTESCPRRWTELQVTPQQNVRVCTTCGREVHFCASKDEALSRAQNMEAVAAPLFTGQPIGKPRMLAA